MNIHFQGKEQSLQEILKCREIRVQYQQYLLNKYRNTVISYKLNIPGPIKNNFIIKKIFDEGLQVFKDKLNETSGMVLEEKILYKDSGPEYFGVLNIFPYLMKKITIDIEETHALGRLYDFDVLNEKGEQISRQELGREPRKCLLCESNAFECGRARKHKVKELIDKVESMAEEYFI
ncbi:citrate lyase holo-[acyl-carrier protein] synthase [Clostridium sp. KNHs214]|uniref:citrate lyase holo-[acyl-carrier protein] synthase n=1 Tax=Clostridium sp. KNHs214 TaxID=1540257 RepID=UPI0005533C07|nr:citrate lyase holo-[acyl-carrier protein] synthase [Clostridium sp. KNHs214]